MQLIVGARVLTQNYFLDIPGTILSLIAVCAGSFVTILLLNVNKQVEGKIRMIREQRKKVVKQGVNQGKLPIPANIISVNI